MGIKVTCCDCGNDIEVSESWYNAVKRSNKQFRCKACTKLWRQQAMKNRMDSMSDDEKKKMYNKIVTKNKINYSKMSKEDIAKRMTNLQKASAEWRKNVTPEEKERISKIHTESNKRVWEEYHNNPEKYAEYLKKLNNRWNNKSEEEKKQFSDAIKDRWKNYDVNQRSAHVKKMISASSNRNKLHSYFESRFNELNYDLIPEYPTTNHGVTHCWDYAVFKDNELCMLVDLDGAYFHADICDYDGIHSKLEYDEKRGLSIPGDVKWCIIYEKDFDKSFTYMQSIIDLTYDEFIVKRVKEYRSMPFPYPEYNDNELLRSYRDLCKLNCNDKYHKSLNVNTRIGDRLIQHFHQSMYNNLVSTWNNDDLLRSMITNGYLYHSYLNKNKILQGFNIYEPCKRTQFISAGKSKMIINRYLSEYNEVFNPCYNYDGIMLACIVMNKRYIGICNDETHLIESSNLLEFLRDNEIDYDVSLSKSNICNQTTYQCLFTEVFTDNQIDECLTKYHCKRYVFLIDNTLNYVDNVIDITNDKFIILI